MKLIKFKKQALDKFKNRFSNLNNMPKRYLLFGDVVGSFINLYCIFKLRLKGIKPGTILVGPNIILRVEAVGAGEMLYKDWIPSMAVTILRDYSPGEHLTGAMMNTYTSLNANDSFAVLNIYDLKIFELKVASETERLIYES